MITCCKANSIPGTLGEKKKIQTSVWKVNRRQRKK